MSIFGLCIVIILLMYGRCGSHPMNLRFMVRGSVFGEVVGGEHLWCRCNVPVCWGAIIMVAEDISFRCQCNLGVKVYLQMTYIDSYRHGYPIEVCL